MNWIGLMNFALIIVLMYFVTTNVSYAYNQKYGGFELFGSSSEPLVDQTLPIENYDTKKGVRDISIPNLDENPVLRPGNASSVVAQAERDTAMTAPIWQESPGSERGVTTQSAQNSDVEIKPVQVAMREGFGNMSKLLKQTAYVSNDETYTPNAPRDKVKQGNTYTNNWNTANFESNVMDLRHFFKRNDSPHKNATVHREAGMFGKKDKEEIVAKSCFPGGSASGASANGGKGSAPVWKYNDELPMNGGEILPGLYGFDNNTPNFAAFDRNAPLSEDNYYTSSMTSAARKRGCPGSQCADDIRNGMGIPSRKDWATQ